MVHTSNDSYFMSHMNFSNSIPFLNWFNFTLYPRLKYTLNQNYDKLVIIGVVSYEILFICRVVHDKLFKVTGVRTPNLRVHRSGKKSPDKMALSTNQNEDEICGPIGKRASRIVLKLTLVIFLFKHSFKPA